MNLILTGPVLSGEGAAVLLQLLHPEPQPPFCCAKACHRRDERRYCERAIKALATSRFRLAGARVHVA